MWLKATTVTSDPAPRPPPADLRNEQHGPPNRPHRAPPPDRSGVGAPHSRAHGYISCLERRRGTLSALGSTPASDPPGLGRSQVFLDRAHPASETDFALHDSGAPEPSFDRALPAVLVTDISETRALPSLPLTGRSRPPSTPTSPRLGRSRAFP
ncbi:hypothetical protein PUN28_002106 [Cardiocondyla obscurior]|uniref:Uncharacterized protein n=1 Tax=Cardiocondyla obscurior TaxID=286306 RepID=A0AAW2GSM2_9HYME